MQVNNTGFGWVDGYSGIVGMAIQPNPPMAALIVSFSGYPSQSATAPNYNIIRLVNYWNVYLFNQNSKSEF